MPGLWAKGRSKGLLTGVVSDSWHARLFKRRRAPGSAGVWLPGDYVLLDIDSDGVAGKQVVLQDRELALVKTHRYFCVDKPQPNGAKLKRWYDFVIMRQVRRRGRGPGWRRVKGTWAGFGNWGGLKRYEWQIEYGTKRWYAHRLAVHAKTGARLQAQATSWQSEHLAGADFAVNDADAGWCLCTFDGLDAQKWDTVSESWADVAPELKQAAREQLHRYRHGSMYV